MEERHNDSDIDLAITKPAVDKPPIPYRFPDPVKQQKEKDKKEFKDAKLEQNVPEKSAIIGTKIEPTISTRIGLHYVRDPQIKEGQRRPTFVLPRTKKHLKLLQKHKKTTFCQYSLSKVPKPIPADKIETKLTVPSPEPSTAKVVPRRITPTSSRTYPYPPTQSELAVKKPKSGIIINVTGEKPLTSDYDSFDLVYSRSPRPKTSKDRSRRRKDKRSNLEDIMEDSEEPGEKRRKKKKRKGKKRKHLIPEEETEQMIELVEDEYEGQMSTIEDYLTRQFRRKVSQMSQSTSYQTRDFRLSEEEIFREPLENKFIQKFRRESEIRAHRPKKRKIKRGTLQSHSFTNLCQPILKNFFFGCRIGTMHQGDESFPEPIRNLQGLCMPVAAYCFAMMKHPNKWTSEDVDFILESGNTLCIQSVEKLHMHQMNKELKPDELQKYCTIDDKKVRFTVEEPDIVGSTRSDDKTVYNLSKGLKIFFARNTCGILKTQEFDIALWKDKYLYMFDAKPRTKDLYPSPNGTALMATFYDTMALSSVFIDRSNFGNWPFVIYPIKVTKIINRDDMEVESTTALNAKSNYNILNEKKAICMGSFDLADKCFGFTRNKQSLTMAVLSLVYSRITPSNAWRRTSIDKIMLLGNQLYLACVQCDAGEDIRVDNLPALFTIGPYVVEIYIFANILVDVMYKYCCCQLTNNLQEFFSKGTNAIIEIGKDQHIAVWKQRDMYYCFDPYSRDQEGFQSRDGTACVSMHSDLESLISLISLNFDQQDNVFHIHALKVCKIHRDPVKTNRFPKHIPMDELPLDEFKKFRMKKCNKPAVEKPMTVDYTALAMIRMLAGEELATSLHEIGSTVESLNMETCLHATKCPSKSILISQPKITEVIADLDSPSLSDTQITPPIPQELRERVGEVEFLDLDSFDLTMEEIELMEVAQEEEGGEGMRKQKWFPEEEGAGDFEGLEGEEEDVDDDWFYAAAKYAQVGPFSLIPEEPSKISEEINTDMTFFPIKRDVLYPTYVRGKQQMKYRLQRYKFTDDNWDTYFPPEPIVTQSQELRKETNFIHLPDDTEIIYGTKNVAEFDKDIEFIAPFVCIMAGVVAKKYSILSWTTEIIDYILKCGKELYSASKFRYDQVSKLEIPKITLGNISYAVKVEYVFDTYIRQNILELAIEKILFVRSDAGVLVTPLYACALFYKNFLYYLYDSFGNNEVGLSEGPTDAGTACFLRFKDIKSLAARIMYNKRKRENDETIIYSKFVLSTIRVKEIYSYSKEEVRAKGKKSETQDDADKEGEYKFDEVEEMEGETGEDQEGEGEGDDGKKKKGKKESKNKVGYQPKNRTFVIEGTKGLEGQDVVSGELKEDHFVCLVAAIMLVIRLVYNWDTVTVDQVIESGKHIYAHADDLDISEKRTIKNMLIGKHFFDVIVRLVKIENWRDRRTLQIGIDTVLSRRLYNFLLQFPNACYVIHKSQDGVFHLFSPYGVGKSPNAGWQKVKDLKLLKRKVRKLIMAGAEAFQFYSFEVTSIQKAPKEILMNYKLMQYNLEMAEKKERLGKPFYEDVEWLKRLPVPWSRSVNQTALGKTRGTLDNTWRNWDIEYRRDLYSLMGNIHQTSTKFSENTRGKQTLANLVVAIGMMEIYELAEWNSAVVDSILVNGDTYFTDCIKDINEEDYEISIDDLKSDCSIFPFAFNVTFTPVVEGTMFLVSASRFNLYKSLRYFFNRVERRSGIICAAKSENKRQVAFGKLQEYEYFMFDCECMGVPMFAEGSGVAYILRMTTLNRLLHVLTLTLRGGEFYMYDVEVTGIRPVS